MDALLIIVSLLVGTVIGYFIGNTLLAKVNKQREEDLDKKKEEINKQSDAIIEDARKVAKRKVDEANGKAKSMVIDAERKNENIKQKKKDNTYCKHATKTNNCKNKNTQKKTTNRRRKSKVQPTF